MAFVLIKNNTHCSPVESQGCLKRWLLHQDQIVQGAEKQAQSKQTRNILGRMLLLFQVEKTNMYLAKLLLVLVTMWLQLLFSRSMEKFWREEWAKDLPRVTLQYFVFDRSGPIMPPQFSQSLQLQLKLTGISSLLHAYCWKLFRPTGKYWPTNYRWRQDILATVVGRSTNDRIKVMPCYILVQCFGEGEIESSHFKAAASSKFCLRNAAAMSARNISHIIVLH